MTTCPAVPNLDPDDALVVACPTCKARIGRRCGGFGGPHAERYQAARAEPRTYVVSNRGVAHHMTVAEYCDRLERGEKLSFTQPYKSGRAAFRHAVEHEMKCRSRHRDFLDSLDHLWPVLPAGLEQTARPPHWDRRGVVIPLQTIDEEHAGPAASFDIEPRAALGQLADSIIVLGDLLELIPQDGLRRVAAVMRAGKPEHGDRWKTHTPEHHLDAARRHIKRHRAGEAYDHDLYAQGHGKISHLACAAARLLMALHLIDDPETT